LSPYQGDVLYFHVENGQPLIPKNIPIVAKFSGNIDYNSTISTPASAYAAIAYGWNTPPWQDINVLQWKAFKFPKAINAPKWVSSFSGQIRNGAFSATLPATLVVYGADAIVPIAIRTYVLAELSHAGETASATALLQLSLILPKGVTCTSRSGFAFNGLCPKHIP
jgi:hypothetical protein